MSSPENNPPPLPGDTPGDQESPAPHTSPEPGAGLSTGPVPYPPWPIWESLLVLGLFTLSQVAVSLGVAAILKWFFGAGSNTGFSEVVRVVVPVSIFSSHAVGWGSIYWVVVRLHRQRFVTGLRLAPHPLPALAWAFAGGGALQIVAAVGTLYFPPPEDFQAPVEEFLRQGPWAVALLFVMAVVMAPPLEEALFRGLLLPALRRRISFWLSALVVTGLFTSLHASQTGAYLPPVVGIALCGFLLAWLRERSGSLWPPIAFHVGFNVTAFLPVLLMGIPV